MASEEISLTRSTGRWWRYVVALFSVAGLFIVVNHVFILGIFGIVLLERAYLYALLAAFLPLVFILFPAKKRLSKTEIPWYDILLFIITLIVFSILSAHGVAILNLGYEVIAPLYMSVISFLGWLLILEAVRRAAGWLLCLIFLAFSVFPLYTAYMPGFLEGYSLSFLETVGYHMMGDDSVLGVVMKVYGRLLCGFLVFGVGLVALGGGKVFMDFALAAFGKHRGGAAKVSVVASGLYGSMSGSSVSNIVTTGAITIPAMKKTGYPPYYAAAVEATASTGGILMPPVMGAVAFIMATILGIPYLNVCIAAALPALLYYFGIFVQVDAHAAINKLRGLDPSELPSLKQALKEMWPFFLALALLVYFLYLRLEAQAAFYALGVLVLLVLRKREQRRAFKQIVSIFIQDSGKVLAQMIAILAGVGFIVGALSVTGVGSAFTSGVVNLAGGNLFLLLLSGAFASYILGLGMTATPCYIFLAVMLAPALITSGLNEIAIHLGIVYWGILANITPPVAVSCLVAAGIAGAKFFKTGWQSMRLAAVIYFLPFFFIVQSALCFQGSPLEVIRAFFSALTGVWLLASSLEGYLMWLGRLNPFARVFFSIAGILLCFPSWQTEIAGIALVIITFSIRIAMPYLIVGRKSA